MRNAIEFILDLLESLMPVIITIAIMAAMAGGLFWLMFNLSESACLDGWSEQRKPEFDVVVGCTVLTDSGERVPETYFRVLP